MNRAGSVNAADNRGDSFEAWAKSLVGRYWEIYWKQERGGDDDNDGSEDSSPRESDRHHQQRSSLRLKKDKELKPPGIGSSAATDNREGKERGRHGQDDEDDEGDDGSSSSSGASHADDWYDAKIESYCRRAGSGVLVFKVTFVGDDDNTVYEMNLTPDIVRPSARAWIRRSLALLGRPEEEAPGSEKGAAAAATGRPVRDKGKGGGLSNGGAAAAWFDSLPPDTATSEDRRGEQSLESLRSAASVHDMPPLPEFLGAATPLESGIPSASTSGSAAAPCPTAADLDSIRELVAQLRWQVHLRKRLTAAAATERHNRAENPDEEGPTGEYLDYLASCLQQLEFNCLWYYRCWALHSRVMGDADGASDGSMGAAKAPADLIDRSYILRDCLDAGRHVISSTCAMDVSVSASKRNKRKSSALSPPPWSSSLTSSPQRRAKRRKKRRTLDWDGESNDETPFLDSLEPEDLLSTQTVVRFVRRAQSTDSRWFLALFGCMLHSLCARVVAPLVAWERRAQLYLGDIESIPKVDDCDGATSNDDSSIGDDDADAQQSDTGNSSLLKYEDIEAAIDAANENTVLKHIQLSDYVARLKEKLSAIDQFNESAWNAIMRVLDDAEGANEPRDMNSDGILEELKGLAAMATSKGPPGLSNIEPLGRSPSTLTRSLIETATHYRSWYLRFVRATVGRERVDFARRTVSDFWTLPGLAFPPIAPGIKVKIARLSPRVEALAANLSHAESMFKKFTPLPTDLTHELTTAEGLNRVLQELRQSPFVSEPEEIMAIRLDILSLKSEFSAVLTRERPLFSDLFHVKASVDLIMQGKSSCRLASISGLEPDTSVDLRIRDFAQQDLTSMCAGLYEKFQSLYSVASSWKDRAEAVILTLRAYGNDAAGPRMASPKLPAMVDLKRVRDLVDELTTISVDLSEFYQTLSRIHSNGVKWADSITSTLYTNDLSFEECLERLRESASYRPEGLIMSPTRQVLESIESLLVWYTNVKQACSSPEQFSRYDLIVEGMEILESFSNSKPNSLVTFPPVEAITLLSSKVSQRCLGRVLSRSKLQANELSDCILSRMIVMERDVAEGYPLLSLLYVLWVVKVEDFTDKCLSGVGNDRYLEKARELMKKPPLPLSEADPLPPFLTASARHPVISQLAELIVKAESTENAARNAVVESTALLRECLQKPFDIPQHLTTLKTLISCLKSPQTGAGLMYDPTLVQQLDHNLKAFQWLLQAFQYPVLRSRHVTSGKQINLPSKGDTRVPWKVLISLLDKLPESGASGDFASVTRRVKELADAAKAWEDEIRSLTKKRLSAPPERSTDDTSNTEEDNRIDPKRLAELSTDPILLEVALPGQSTFQTLLSATGAFEAQLQEFLGRDNDGVSPDRAAYPLAGSLVGRDGSFMLYRLTENSLFGTLNSAMKSMSEAAGKVLADTPGKAALKWIQQIVSWFESLGSSVCLMNLRHGGSKLVISCQSARHLVDQATGILLNVSDDLRRTLRAHKVFIRTRKHGKLTVRTLEGGAHRAVGVRVIRWFSVLFESLKADYARHEEWQKDMVYIARSFVAFKNAIRSKYDEESFLTLHRFHDDVLELLEQVTDLVVAPLPSMLDNGDRLLLGIKTDLSASTPGIAAKHSSRSYRDPESLVRNRSLLLDSLVHRKNLEQVRETLPASVDTKNGPFRGAARTLFQHALLNGVSAVGMARSTQDAISFCALKAWEIENEIFAAFQGDASFGDSKISPEYRDFARALKRSLEDPENLSFCVRVLTGKVEAIAIARMSVLDLASPKTKEERERARAAASHWMVLDSATKPLALKHPPHHEEDSKLAKRGSMNLSGPLEKPAPPQTTQNVERSDQGSPVANRVALNVDLGRQEQSLKLPVVAKITVASNQRPPPPPSLAAALVAVPSASRRSQAPVTNASGTDRSNIALSAGTFVAGFVTESDQDNIAEGLLPESFVEKGRLRDDEFAKFVRSKLEGGKWSVATFRLVTFSNKDEREHRKYCKEYESRMRLAMFSLSEESKVFLVTPMFHASVRSLSFENASSTYAVALVRR